MTRPINEEDSIIRQAQHGDLEAYERLYRQHVATIYGLALRLCGRPRPAEELTQDAFVQAWKSIRGFKFKSSFRTWMHRITVNCYLQDRRRESSRQSQWVPDPSDTRILMSGDSGQVINLQIDLERAIDRLPPGARMILILHDIEGYRHEEIAEMLNLSVGTSKTQLQRARTIIKEIWQA
ncbi:MAG: RNA polymerase sigma factor [Candidatus Delongbacteria bacterium]|nr:RNA polymerase sigma factor [Candidatus Delongbacteria bacterium]